MKCTRLYLGPVIGGATTLALLAACSGGNSVAPAGNATGAAPLQSVGATTRISHANVYTVLSPKGRATLNRAPIATRPFVNVAGIDAADGNQVLVSDFTNNTVTIFGGGGQVNANLTSSTGLNAPQGMTTDRLGTLYVANTGASNVLVFPKPYTAVSLTLDDSKQYPGGVALDASGNVAVMNIVTTSAGPGTVSLYSKNATTACATVGNSNWATVYFGAFDKAGNLYVDGRDVSGNTVVGTVTGGCNATTITPLTFNNSIAFPGGVAVLKNGNVVIDDQSGLNLFTYAPMTGGSLGSPISTTPLSGAGDPVTFAIKDGDMNLWTADAHAAVANKYRYPAGGTPIKTFGAGTLVQPIGVAVNPAQTL